MKNILLLILVISLIGIITPNAFGQSVPEWVKNTAGWWATNQIDDSSFLQGIQYLIKEGIMLIDSTKTSESSGSQEVPSWIKNNAGWWADGMIDDSSFISGIQWLISNGIIIVEEKLIHTDANLRVAFIGDQGLNANSIAVLELIKDERAELVLLQGDFDYVNCPDCWDRQISDVLGSDFPFFASVGNHEVQELNDYQEKMYDRLEKNPDAVCHGDLGIKSSCNYKGLFFLLAAPGIAGSDHDSFIKKQLNNNDFMWRVCSWHYDIHAMQIESEPNKTGWEVYEACKNGGAIIANGHMHSYLRTKTLMYVENQIVNPEWPEPNKLTVKEGNTFVVVSGLAGQSIRIQDDCFPTSYPYGCDELASVYTWHQDANYGALFCTFNVNGQPNKADCYFKDIDGKIIDEFTITNFVGIDDDGDNRPEIDLSKNDLSGEDLTDAILVETDLTDVNLTGTILKGANLSVANLTGVDLSGKDLTGTMLKGANLTGTNLTDTDLTGAILVGTNLTDANLSRAILDETNLSNSNLTGVDLSGRDLTGTMLKGANLAYADITGTILKEANLSKSYLAGADLSDKDLTGTILNGANLVNTKLIGTILKEANLSNSNLTGVDLSDTDLTGTFLRGANFDYTILPDVGLTEKDFEYASFIGVDLSGKDLTDSDFSRSKLDNANIENTDLMFSKFVDVNLTKIKNKSLAGATLVSTSFAHSNLSGVSLDGATLHEVNFNSANLSGQDFTIISDNQISASAFISANLSDSNFEGVDLSYEGEFTRLFENKAHLKNLQDRYLAENLFGTSYNNQIMSTEVRGNDLLVTYITINNFDKANLENANFKNADLMITRFHSANLAGADLSGVNLTNSLMTNADLTNTNLDGAILSGVVFTDTNLNCLNHPICNNN